VNILFRAARQIVDMIESVRKQRPRKVERSYKRAYGKYLLRIQHRRSAIEGDLVVINTFHPLNGIWYAMLVVLNACSLSNQKSPCS
jgi:hypothetical protein